MKIRTGFVSNSSASSFVVKIKNWLEVEKLRFLISKDKINLLEKFGFWKSTATIPSHVSWRDFDDESLAKAKEGKDYWSYAYSVSCNEDEVLHFLVDNKIPFSALCHYDHYLVYYDGKNKIIVARNYGMEIMGLEEISLADMKEENPIPIKTMTVKKFKKNGYYI